MLDVKDFLNLYCKSVDSQVSHVHPFFALFFETYVFVFYMLMLLIFAHRFTVYLPLPKLKAADTGHLVPHTLYATMFFYTVFKYSVRFEAISTILANLSLGMRKLIHSIGSFSRACPRLFVNLTD